MGFLGVACKRLLTKMSVFLTLSAIGVIMLLNSMKGGFGSGQGGVDSFVESYNSERSGFRSMCDYNERDVYNYNHRECPCIQPSPDDYSVNPEMVLDSTYLSDSKDDLYEPFGLNPSELFNVKDIRYDAKRARDLFGRSLWTILHLLAVYYPDNPSDEKKRSINTFIHLIPRIYPCAECCIHSSVFLKHNPPQLGDSESFGEWVCELHNLVNARLGKKFYDCSRWREYWDPDYHTDPDKEEDSRDNNCRICRGI